MLSRSGVICVSIVVAAIGGACGDTAQSGSCDDDACTGSTSGEAPETSGGAASSAGEGDEGSSRSGGTSADETGDPAATGESAAGPTCGDGAIDPGEDCDDGNADDFDGCRSDCTTVEILEPPPLRWAFYEIEGTTCLDGSTAGFGINYNPDSSDVMIYLDGGGACFTDACDGMWGASSFGSPTDGIFSRTNEANPVRDFTMIEVLYCTGDIYAGDADVELGGRVRSFRGYRNIERFLQHLVPSVPAERVLLTGSSAGGFGAAVNAYQVAKAYGEDVEVVVIDDAGPPLNADVIPPCLQDVFRETWNVDGTALATCPECDPQNFPHDLLAQAIAQPNVRLGLYSATEDIVIRSYMGFGWGGGHYDDCESAAVPVSAQVFADGLFALREEHLDTVSTYYVGNSTHTALRGASFELMWVDGVSLPEWIADVLEGNVTHVGP